MYATVHCSLCLLCSCMCAHVYNVYMYVCMYRVLVYMYMPAHKQLACYAHVFPVIYLCVIYVHAVPMHDDFLCITMCVYAEVTLCCINEINAYSHFRLYLSLRSLNLFLHLLVSVTMSCRISASTICSKKSTGWGSSGRSSCGPSEPKKGAAATAWSLSGVVTNHGIDDVCTVLALPPHPPLPLPLPLSRLLPCVAVLVEASPIYNISLSLYHVHIVSYMYKYFIFYYSIVL